MPGTERVPGLQFSILLKNLGRVGACPFLTIFKGRQIGERFDPTPVIEFA
jgi:hypothetical protein